MGDFSIWARVRENAQGTFDVRVDAVPLTSVGKAGELVGRVPDRSTASATCFELVDRMKALLEARGDRVLSVDSECV